MNLKDKTNTILNTYGIKAKKKYGQNFLIDENIIDSIVDLSNISKNDVVIEIGPGLGNLTEKLIDKAVTVIAFEIDEDMCDILAKRFKNTTNLILINKDILKVDLKQTLKEHGIHEENVKVVANLPYYITTPIMFKIFEESCFINSMTIMVQKEVADRIISNTKSKDYGVLTINTKYYGIAEKLFDVPNTSFIPMPNVTSSVIKINISKNYNVKDEKVFFKLIKAAFSQRRKKLINSLINSNAFEIDKNELKNILLKNEIADNARAEEIDIETYIKIADDIYEKIRGD